ncbi:MAG TPA: ABC transporter substrate-binding protein [Clostridia bacterium]|jgi:ABC-type glycerol-3-phosphate transport system substrate-binding protein|nr:ABC transporter substrate-binding protein [Clostridia bacterium]
MKKNWIRIIAICLLVVFVGTTVGCTIFEEDGPRRTPSSTPKPTPREFVGQITFSTYKRSPNDVSAHAFAHDFAMIYPNVDIVIDEMESAEEYFATLDERIKNGTIGDVFVIDDSRIAEYVENDYIVDFTPYLEDLIEYKTYKRLKPHEILFDAAYKSAQYKKGMYMMPTDYNHKFVFINYDLFSKAGLSVPGDKWTFEDFVRCAEELSKLDEVKIPAVMDYLDPAIWGAFARGFTGVLFPEEEEEEKSTETPASTDENGDATPDPEASPSETPAPTKKEPKIEKPEGSLYYINKEDSIITLTLTNEEVLMGLTELAEIIKQGYVQKADVNPEDLSGIGMIVTDKMEFNTWTDVLRNAEFEWDLIHFPTLPKRFVGVNTLGLAVSTKTAEASEEQKDMSVQFALHTLIQEAAVVYAGNGESVPASKAVNAMKFWREYPVRGKNTSVFATYTENDFPSIMTYLMNIEAAREYHKIGEAIENYINNGASLEDALKEIEDRVHELWEQEPVYAETPEPTNTPKP